VTEKCKLIPRCYSLILFSLLKLLNKRRLDELKYKWWEANPDRVVCPEVKGDDTFGGISIYNIGKAALRQSFSACVTIQIICDTFLAGFRPLAHPCYTFDDMFCTPSSPSVNKKK